VSDLLATMDVDLGPCCACRGASGKSTRNLIMLEQLSPLTGHGWGCVYPGCELPPNGALAVICDECLKLDRPLVDACRGYPAEEGRVPIDALEGEWRHAEVPHL
jgi:hypothetical protein